MEKVEEKKVNTIAQEIEQEADKPAEAPYDDRNELIEVTYGPKPDQYVTVKLPKAEAFQTLYDYYNGNSTTTVPRNRPTGVQNLGNPDNNKINNATLYVKMRYKDHGTGEMMTIVKDLPLWIAIERAVSHKHHVEVITKVEHDAFYVKRDAEQNEWRVQLAQEQRRLNDMAGNPQPIVNRSKVEFIK